MNKLRVLSVGGGAMLVIASGWAALRYSGSAPFVRAALLGLLVAALPPGLARAKLTARRGRRLLHRARADAPPPDASFVTESAVADPDAELAAIADAVRDADGLEAVRREPFGDEEGLVVTHAGFHSSFVRPTPDDHLAVTGASERTRRLAAVVEADRPYALTQRTNNPLRRPDPVRGAPRVFLGVLLVALLVVGAGTIAGGAYPGNTYTAGEKAVLVSIDARADADPGMSATNATLAKAEFVVLALEEEAVEIRWESNSSRLLAEHGRQSLRMSEDARSLLADARADSSTARQAARIERIEADLHAAEAAAARALTARLESGTLESDTAELRAARDALQAAAERPVRY